MTTRIDVTPANDRELAIGRIIDAPPAKVFRAWTDPDVLVQWFAPRPYTTPVAEIDLRPGGRAHIVMRGPDGTEHPADGVYLEVVPNRKLVSTDAFVRAWEPSAKPFMTLTVTLEDEGGRTRYIARCAHWTVEDRETHEKMGFHEGWGICAEQLEEVARKL